METVQVVIVGAGPSGLALALALGQHGVKSQSIILEKELGVTQDPRGVYLADDATRILYDLGLGDRLGDFGHEVPTINFHKTRLANAPFLTLLPNRNQFDQAVPDGVLQRQPKLEQSMRDVLLSSPNCELRESCEVVKIKDEGDFILVEYKAADGSVRTVRSAWLVGADGKKGIVRKYFLEPVAGIVQQPGIFPYEATWIAANFKIHIPTPKSHPNFPLWQMGYRSRDVYDLYWPTGWHFCSPPGTAVACGRFGPLADRLWRHEIPISHWDDSMDALEILMENVSDLITRSADAKGRSFGQSVQFPLDCIEVIRCRPFRFAHKIVNKWFYNRTVLIGDAAHVFPPFGGQGIACGIRDAHSLAWRLSLLSKMKDPPSGLSDDILNRWSLERRQSVYDSSKTTTISGALCNEQDEGMFYAFRHVVSFLSKAPVLSHIINADIKIAHRAGCQGAKHGFHTGRGKGGIRIPQVYVQRRAGKVFLSDQLWHRETVLSLLIIDEYPEQHLKQITQLIRAINIDPAVISTSSIVLLDPHSEGCESFDTTSSVENEVVRLAQAEQGKDLVNPQYYDERALVRILGRSIKYAIVRPDFMVFGCAASYQELLVCLQTLKQRLLQ